MRPGARALALWLALLAGVIAAGAARAADETWLLGRWELVHAPDGDQKDWLEFAPDGRMTSIAPNGRRTDGRWTATGAAVQLDFKVGTRTVIITLTHGPDKQRLYQRSAKTGNTSVYEKRP
jgi:hypothetical protein